MRLRRIIRYINLPRFIYERFDEGINLYRNPHYSKLVFSFFLFLFSLITGTVAYIYLEGFSFWDAFYQTVITVSTVGFNEVEKLSQNGKIFTSFYILFNVVMIAYVVSVISRYIFEGEINSIFSNYRTLKNIRKMKNHIILIGYGRNGAKAMEEFVKNENDLVAIERDEAIVKKFHDLYPSHQVLNADATDEKALLDANITVASSIVLTGPDDAENILIILSARELNPNIKIVARATKENAKPKMLKAGADAVVMPDSLGGLRMANLIIRPGVIQLPELLSASDGLHLETVIVNNIYTKDNEELVHYYDLEDSSGVVIIGNKDVISNSIHKVSKENTIIKGQHLIVFGYSSDIERLRALVEGKV